MQKTKDWSEMGKKDKNAYHAASKALYGSGIAIEIDYKAPIKPKVKRKKRTYAEQDIQMKIVSWLRSEGILFTAIPNGAKRSIISGQIERAMGLTAGVADLFIAEPRNGLAGYWVELKALGKKPTELQQDWLAKARQRGYKADWFDSYNSAKEAIYKYLHQI